MPFDAKTIKLLEPGKSLTSAEYPGLRLVASTSKRTWTYRYRSPVDDALRQKKIGEFPATSIAKAIVAWEGLVELRNAGLDPVLEEKSTKAKVEPKAPEKVLTVGDVADFYYEGHIAPGRGKKDAAEMRRMFGTIPADVRSLPAESISRSQAFDFINEYKNRAPVQAGRLKRELAAAWDFATDGGKLSENTPNWWRMVLRRKIQSRGKKINGEYVGTAKRVLRPGEVTVLLNQLHIFSESVRDGLTLYLWLGVRGAEVASIEGRDVWKEDSLEHEGEQWWWVVPKAKTKNHRHERATDLRIPLFGRALEVILRRKEKYGDGWLFPRYSSDRCIGHLGRDVFTNGVHFHQPYCTLRPEVNRERLKVSHWTPHDLRRTARTLLASLGCDKDVAESIVGHLRPGVDGIYNLHQYDAERVEWLRKLDSYLAQLAAS